MGIHRNIFSRFNLFCQKARKVGGERKKCSSTVTESEDLKAAKDLPLKKIEHGKKALAVIEQVADEVVSLCQSFEAKKISESMLNSTILGLVLEIVIFSTESILKHELKRLRCLFGLDKVVM